MACSNPDVLYVLCGQFTAGKESHFISWFAPAVMPTHTCFKLVAFHQRGEEKVCLKPNREGKLGEVLSHRKISQHV